MNTHTAAPANTRTTDSAKRPRDPGTSTSDNPILICLGVLAGAYALLFVSALMLQRPIYLVQYFDGPGIDFRDFWIAARDFLDRANPYLRARFVTPPLSLLPIVPLALVPLSQAVRFFFVANLCALAAGIALLTRHYALSGRAFVLLCLTCALSSSGLMLLERGNIDGLVFLAVCASLYAIDSPYTSGSLLACAAMLKVYPTALLPPLVVQRRARIIALCFAIVVLSIAVFPASHVEFVKQQIVRSGSMRLDENLSFLSLFWVASRVAGGAPSVFLLAGSALFAAFYLAFLVVDAKLFGKISRPQATFLLSTYVIFFLNFPPLVYLYSGVNLLILLAAASSPALALPATHLRRIAVFCGLALVPARSFGLSLGGPLSYAANFIPPLAQIGLLITGIGVRLFFRSAIAKATLAS